MNNCEQCGIEFQSKRGDAKFCSPKCRKEAFLKRSVGTDNVTFSEPKGTDNFEFYTISKANGLGRPKDEKSTTRIGKYWYDVPLGAIPIIKKDWPIMPIYMNGRQYFLWWKNNFETRNDEPIILNPFPVYDNLTYVQAGDNSRRWGA